MTENRIAEGHTMDVRATTVSSDRIAPFRGWIRLERYSAAGIDVIDTLAMELTNIE